MGFKVIIVIAALVASVSAKPGGPAAYSISAPSVDHASVGNTQEHTVKGHYGQSSQSDYSSQVQTAHSQSHVQRSSSSNDAGYAPHYGGHVVAAAAAPVAHAYAAPAAYGIAHAAAPAYAHGLHYAAAAPAATAIYTSHHAEPSAYGYGGYGYAAHAAPATLAYAQHSYAAPAYQLAAAAPSYGHGYIASAPAAYSSYKLAAPAYAAPAIGIAAHGYAGYAAAPAYAAHAYAAPAYAVKAAPALVHTSVAGHGVHYGY